MHHARAQNLKPAIAFTDLQLTVFPRTLNVDLGRGFGEGEVRRAEAGLDAFDLEEGGKEFFQNPFQVRHRDVLVDGKAFDLMEHRRVGLVIVGTIHTARRNDAARCAVLFHMADLHGAGVGAQHVRRAIITLGAVHIERVHLGPRGVVAGDVQRVEVIEIGVDLRTFGNGEPHVGKDRRDLFDHLTDRVDRANARITGRQRHVQPFGFQTFVQRRIAQRLFLGGQGCVDLVLQRVQLGAHDLTLFRRHLAQLAHFQADLAFFANCLHTQIFQRCFIASVRDQIDILVAQIIHFTASGTFCA